jgi:uncharacterized protein YbjT (DUF2867 family)
MCTDAVHNAMTPILSAGASGYVGSHLLDELRSRDRPVRALVRNPAGKDLPAELRKGDAVTGEGLHEALDGVEVAYYLIHSMEGNGDFAARDRAAAVNFGEAASAAGVERVVYLGGLGPTGADASEHLRSRHEVAQLLAQRVRTVYVRAAMVIGPGSASFEILRHLVGRLPVMVTPRWIDTRSQPVAIADVTATLAALATRQDAPGEVQLGGADVLTYRDMIRRFAAVEGRRQPVLLPVPLFTPRLSSYWVALVTPVDLGLVKPLVEGLSAETVVRHPPPAGLNDAPLGFDDAVRAALAG